MLRRPTLLAAVGLLAAAGLVAPGLAGAVGAPEADVAAPVAVLTDPASGTVVSGTVTVRATASDGTGVTAVELLVDGVRVARLAQPPYAFVWDTATVAGGAHTLRIRARDAAGNVGRSAKVDVTVANGGCPTPPGQATGADLGSVALTVDVATAGTYRVWSRLRSAERVRDSYLLQVDGRCPVVVGDTPLSPGVWTWVGHRDATATAAVLVPLTVGRHRLTLVGREGGVDVDRLLLTGDVACVPTGADGGACAPAALPVAPVG